MKQTTALDILKTGENCFVTGSAGTGKSYLLNQYIHYLKERKITPTITAPTGIAASHLGGQTIHSFFGLGIRDQIDEGFLKSLRTKKHILKRFEKLKVLIIDEISMVSPEIFTAIDRILRAFIEPFAPFGGVQVVVCGDFFQLPPVSKEPREKRFAWQSPAWRELAFHSCYLDEKYRQDDPRLIQLLDEIRSGTLSDTSHTLLQERIDATLSLDYTPTKLYTHNVDVDGINKAELEKLSTPTYTFEAITKGSERDITKILGMSLLKEALTLKRDAVVIFIKNSQEGSYVNGTTGVVTGFDSNDGLPIVTLADHTRLKVTREEWVLEDEEGKRLATITQVPLRLAWAITIHKSQGMTLDSAQIDLSKTFEMGQGYVALSRVKNSQTLKLLGINEMALRVDPLIRTVDQRIQHASQQAQATLEAIEDLPRVQRSHIRELGGTNNTAQIARMRTSLNQKSSTTPKPSSHQQTLALLPQHPTLTALAKARGLTTNTILTHLAKLKEADPTLDLEPFRPSPKHFKPILKAIEALKHDANHADYNEAGKLKLKSIYDKLEGKIGYEKIQLVMLFHEG